MLKILNFFPSNQSNYLKIIIKSKNIKVYKRNVILLSNE